MAKVLVIGAGGVGSVAVHKMAGLPEVFLPLLWLAGELLPVRKLQNRWTPGLEYPLKLPSRCRQPPGGGSAIGTGKTGSFGKLSPSLQDLVLMDACLEVGVHYLDTANYEPRDEAKFEYSWQWQYQDKFANQA